MALDTPSESTAVLCIAAAVGVDTYSRPVGIRVRRPVTKFHTQAQLLLLLSDYVYLLPWGVGYRLLWQYLCDPLVRRSPTDTISSAA